jgi:hypothetical protein
MAITAAKAEKLRAAFNGPLTAGEIAKLFRMASAQMVRKFWAGEKNAGRLPEQRPLFAVTVAEAEPIEADVVDVSDESPIHDPNPRYVRQCDGALAALRAHHADDAEAHTAPASWLVWDRTRPARSPSHAALMLMCREHDARVPA